MPASEQINIQPNHILVITLRFLGDTLLTTPLISSLKQAYPCSTIDVLTFKSNAPMLEGNPDIHRVITIDNKPSLLNYASLLLRLFRRYDLAISTQAGDRPVQCAIIAGKTSLGFVPEETSKAWWKKWLLTDWLEFKTTYNHAVLENLRFCQQLGIASVFRVTPPQSTEVIAQLPDWPYAVLHIQPQWKYKAWHRDGWYELIKYLIQSGLCVVLTGSKQEQELKSLSEICALFEEGIVNLAGKLSLAQLSELISRASLFVGPDTGITHLAAATGVPTVALFGPTDPQKWAPWPTGYAKSISPFAPIGSQQIGNVYLIQGQTDKGCLPCQKEGCERHRHSYSECLDQLPAETVISIIRQVIKSTQTPETENRSQ